MEEKEELKYKVIKTGSTGNAVLIEDMLFDCGIPFRELKEYLYGVKYLFITHRHSDHLKLTTFRTILKKFPRIKVIANWDIACKVPVGILVGDNTTINLPDRKIISFACIHNVPTHGFVVDFNNKTIIYATDTSSLENAPKIKYDYLFIESNHDENKINQVMLNGRKKYGYDVFSNAKRHLSTQQAKAFYYMNRRDEKSKWIELHQSHRFY